MFPFPLETEKHARDEFFGNLMGHPRNMGGPGGDSQNIKSQWIFNERAAPNIGPAKTHSHVVQILNRIGSHNSGTAVIRWGCS
jgi:hypothetical protein